MLYPCTNLISTTVQHQYFSNIHSAANQPTICKFSDVKSAIHLWKHFVLGICWYCCLKTWLNTLPTQVGGKASPQAINHNTNHRINCSRSFSLPCQCMKFNQPSCAAVPRNLALYQWYDAAILRKHVQTCKHLGAMHVVVNELQKLFGNFRYLFKFKCVIYSLSFSLKNIQIIEPILYLDSISTV
jgi:hypothetical protein